MTAPPPRPDVQTPPRDYAVLSAGFATAVAALAVAARRRRGEVGSAQIGELPALMLATFGLSRILVHERVAGWVRSPFVDEGAEGRPARGTGVRHAVGELVTCTRCTGVWVGAGLVGTRVLAPALGQTVMSVFAAAGANALLQAGFARLKGD